MKRLAELGQMDKESALSRKDFLKAALVGAGTMAMPFAGLTKSLQDGSLTIEDLKSACKSVGLEFSEEELKGVLSDVKGLKKGYDAVRDLKLTNGSVTSSRFLPLINGSVENYRVSVSPGNVKRKQLKGLSDEDIAFASIRELAHWMSTKQISSRELTDLYLKRLKRYGDALICVISLTEDIAKQQSKKADEQFEKGTVLSPLQGIPYGLKDLFSVKGFNTTWGAGPYENQKIDVDCAVYEKLRSAGAVLVAKLSMGALAMNDVWFKGKTKNPWNSARGSSGSSAGSASATAAGLVGFAIGTETYGSIMSPSNECRVTGLRPTFGRVSRYGAMELSPSLDKAGPMCREVEDCALVLATICGADIRDPSSVNRSFVWTGKLDPKKVKVGVLGDTKNMDSDDATKMLREIGFDPKPVTIKPLTAGVDVILDVECAAAFDAFTRDGTIRTLKDSLWPGIFRSARFVTAVEYAEAMRARYAYMVQFEKEFGEFDVIMAKGIGESLIQTNFTGHPQILVPFGSTAQNTSMSRSFIGRLYSESILCSVAKAFQGKAGHLGKRPDLSKI